MAGAFRALYREDLNSLTAWAEAERPLNEQLDGSIRRRNDKGEVLPLTYQTIGGAYSWLVSTLGLSADLVEAPKYIVRSYQYFKNQDPPEGLLLNSFYLNDLYAARKQFKDGTASSNLKRYLGVIKPEVRHDLLEDTEAVDDALAPDLIPPARWPGPGRHSLVLLQQAAVNLALRELKTDGILAVNGPPGTGKTTLLRDLVSAIITRRAEAMCAFDDPVKAFTHSGEKTQAGNAWMHMYRLDPKLKGFEMVVASTNNKAVQNVSAELPGLHAIADDADNLRYFSTISDAVAEKETWGLIAGVLGNSKNRFAFNRTFWWDDELSFRTYLSAASGTPQNVPIIDPETQEVIGTRPRKIVTCEEPPSGHAEALARWKKARSAFQTALKKSRAELKTLAEARTCHKKLLKLEDELRERKHDATQADHAYAAAQDAVRQCADTCTKTDEYLQKVGEAQRHHQQARPGFFARLFRTRRARDWTDKLNRLTEVRSKGAAAKQAADKRLAHAKSQASDAEQAAKAATARRLAAASAYNQANSVVEPVRRRLGAQFVDDALFESAHAFKHQLTPWLDKPTQRLRDDVFIAALNLHRAFIDVAAKPLKHNIGVLMKTMMGNRLATAEQQSLLADMWSSFFLAVPLVSTTFASVERMLGGLPPQALGWLLIDEAGQVPPQAAVGALMRTKRAVVVGDPVQVEPVVTLPETLTKAICLQFGCDPDHFNAPEASAQTLADATTAFCAEFPARSGSRTVGVPLLMHRRCAEPMFSISNAVAYEYLMVSAKKPGPSSVRDQLGRSCWIDVEGGGTDKWCQEEGDAALRLLRQLSEDSAPPDLYIITPFVIVAEKLRTLVQKSGVANRWTDDVWAWTRERIGTVHTVQGREAEAVIFVLGAPLSQQIGARNWAGGRPNILNVAVTRAKEVLYVVGNRRLWKQAGVFQELDKMLPNSSAQDGAPTAYSYRESV